MPKPALTHEAYLEQVEDREYSRLVAALGPCDAAFHARELRAAAEHNIRVLRTAALLHKKTSRNAGEREKEDQDMTLGTLLDTFQKLKEKQAKEQETKKELRAAAKAWLWAHVEPLEAEGISVTGQYGDGPIVIRRRDGCTCSLFLEKVLSGELGVRLSTAQQGTLARDPVIVPDDMRIPTVDSELVKWLLKGEVPEEWDGVLQFS
jgi:hypothetical protein